MGGLEGGFLSCDKDCSKWRTCNFYDMALFIAVYVKVCSDVLRVYDLVIDFGDSKPLYDQPFCIHRRS